MVRGLSPNHRNGKRHTAWNFCSCREKPGTCHTTKMEPTSCPAHPFCSRKMLMGFLNRGCEIPSSGLECHLTADVAECIRLIYALFGILMMERTLCTSETITPWAAVSNRYRIVCHMCMTRDGLLQHVQTSSYKPPALTFIGLCFHTGWCNAKSVDDGEILEIFEFNIQKYMRNRHFSSWDKIHVDQCY
jgi:hypothetical protein